MSDTNEVKPTPVAREKFTKILDSLGITWEAQSGFLKVFGPKGRHLYVAKTKNVARVDISGFQPEFAARSPHTGTFGNVKSQLEMRGLSEEDILRNFSALAEHMMTLPPVEPKPKKEPKPKAPKNAGAEVQTETVLPNDAQSAAAREARLALIKKVAAEMGAAVSGKTVEELSPEGLAGPTEAQENAAEAEAS